MSQHMLRLLQARRDPKPAPRLDDLAERAARLWPDNPAMQARWIAAARMVRASPGGWVLDIGSKPRSYTR